MDNTEDVLERFDTKGCNLVHTIGLGPELFLTEVGEKLLDEEDQNRFKLITGTVTYHEQVFHDDIFFAINQLATALAKPSKPNLGAAKYLLRYLPGTVNASITYKQGGFKQAAYSDAH